MSISMLEMKDLIDRQSELIGVLSEHIAVLESRINMLEQQVPDNAARMIAVMTLLRASFQCAPNKAQIQALAESSAAMTQIQPGVQLNTHSRDTFQKMKAQLDWLMVPPTPLE